MINDDIVMNPFVELKAIHKDGKTCCVFVPSNSTTEEMKLMGAESVFIIMYKLAKEYCNALGIDCKKWGFHKWEEDTKTIEMGSGCELMNAKGFGDFGFAIKQLKLGKKVCRKGWNGKNMWIVLMPAFRVEDPSERTQAHGITGSFDCGGYIVMWTAQKVWQPGWLASQADILADDWQVYDPVDNNLKTD